MKRYQKTNKNSIKSDRKLTLCLEFNLVKLGSGPGGLSARPRDRSAVRGLRPEKPLRLLFLTLSPLCLEIRRIILMTKTYNDHLL